MNTAQISPYAYVGMVTGFSRHKIKINNPENLCERINNEIMSIYSLSEEDYYSKDRRQVIVEARQMAMVILRQKNISLQCIAKSMRKDHTTVIHGVTRMKNLISTEPKMKDRYESICARINHFSIV